MDKAIELINDKIKKLSLKHSEIEESFQNARNIITKDLIIERMRVISAKMYCLLELKEELEKLYGEKKEDKG